MDRVTSLEGPADDLISQRPGVPEMDMEQVGYYQGRQDEEALTPASSSSSCSDWATLDQAKTSEEGEGAEDERECGYEVEDTEPSGLEAHEAQSLDDDSDNSAHGGDMYSSEEEEEPCPLCNKDLDCCRCTRCSRCHNLEYQCRCETCQRCLYTRPFCRCPCCMECAKKVPDCECTKCMICGEIPYDCQCVCSQDSKIVVLGNLMQHVGTSQLNTRIRRTANNIEGETLVLRGDLKSSHVLVVRKPSVVFAAVYSSIRGSMISKYKTVSEKVSHRVTTTRIYKQVKPWYDTMAFYLEPEVEPTHINVKTVRGVRKMVTQLSKLVPDPRKPTIGFDCEGDNLGRYGTTCYTQIRDYPNEQTYLVDLLTLGQAAWDTVGADNMTTLKTIFERRDIVKIIFDVRGDSNALYKDYGIKLAGVLDMQYLALLGMEYPRKYRVGFVSTVQKVEYASEEERDQWLLLKSHEFKDHDYSVFKQRPLPKALKQYAVNDVLGVDKLAAKLTEKLTARGLEPAFEWTQKEVEWTWAEEYEDTEAETPEGFPACWAENINRYTNGRRREWTNW